MTTRRSILAALPAALLAPETLARIAHAQSESAQSEHAQSEPTAQAPLAPVGLPSPVALRSRILPNGLTVLSVADRKSPVVAVQVWYRVGSKDDPAGRSGFAHLFEHLMFKRTKNMADETLDRLTEDVGGENNAYTSADVTVYHEIVPSSYLETLLWAEAERMANLQVEPDNFASERDVVKEEFRQSVLAPPYGRLDDALESRSWSVHPYKRPTIGNVAELNASTLDDVRAFHSTFYRPDNATLIVVGDFDDAALDTSIDRWFGRIARPSSPIPRVSATEPARSGERRYRETGPIVPLPAVAATYLIPSARSADVAPLTVLDAVLSGGESARLHRALIYRQQVASEAFTYVDARADAGLFVARATAAGGKTLDAVEKSLVAEIDRVRTTPVEAAELRRAKDLLLTALLHGRESADGIAAGLGAAGVIEGDPSRINTLAERLAAVTPDDLLRVAKAYLAPENRVVIRYENGADTRPVPAEAPRTPLKPKTPFTASETPPPPSAPRRVVLPTATERRLPNGLRLAAVARPGSGLAAIRLIILSGAALDNPEKAGRASFAADLLARGTTKRGAEALAEAAERLGGGLSTSAGWDSVSIGMTVPVTRLREALTLISEVARAPAFAAAEIERLRAEKLDDLTTALRTPGFLASAAVGKLVFGTGPWGRLRGGTPETLKRLRRDDLLAFHRATFRPDNAALAIAGDLDPGDALQLAQSVLGGWERPVSAKVAAPQAAVPPVTRRVWAIDLPGAGQTAVALARPGIGRTDPSYFAGLVASTVYGGGYSSRLNLEIRVRRGLAYGAGAFFDSRRGAGRLVASAQTRHEAAAEVAAQMNVVLERLAIDPIAPNELAARKASLTGPYARGLQTVDGVVGELADLIVLGLPLRLGDYIDGVEAVTAAQARSVASNRLAARYSSLALVGNTKMFLPELRRRYGRVTVIPASKLEL